MIVIYIMFNTYTHLIGCTTSKNFQIHVRLEAVGYYA